MRILVTGGAGFVGSHIAERYAKSGCRVTIVDNFSRAKLLKKKSASTHYNIDYLRQFRNIQLVRSDIRSLDSMKKIAQNVDVIFHTAGQTAVTTSVLNPIEDFSVNVQGTLSVLEAARLSKRRPAVILCSTNKVYGENVNQIAIRQLKSRYAFKSSSVKGVSENLSVDHCEHTPYGCSKLTADLYAQDYARLYGLKVGVFRMSCIYGTRQFGVEDQGWVSWFVIAAIKGLKVKIYGDGKQVRDVLWVEDLVNLFDRFVKGKESHVILNAGGGLQNTISLLELIELLREEGLNLSYSFSGWRPSDQKVYISDIRAAKKRLSWTPKVSPREGIRRLISWVRLNRNLFT